MSNINPQSIDGTYPIAGQDNNSQGFRDNFTNTVNNFTFAAAELTDLQQNAVLKAALGSVGQTTVTNDMNYALLTHAQIKGSVETAALNLTVTANAFVLNWELAHFQSVDLTAATGDATFTFSNWPAANYFTKLRLQVTVTGGTRTLTFPSGININISTIQGYTSGQAVSLGNGVYVFEFSTVNFGANVIIEDVLRNYGVSTVNYQFYQPSANVAITANVNVSRVILAPTPSGGIVSFFADVTLPNTTVDGTVVSISSNVAVQFMRALPGWGIYTVSPSANIALTAGDSASYLLNTATSKWYKVG
jgi:hypothetical protein